MKSIPTRITTRFTALVALTLPLAVTIASLTGCGGGGGEVSPLVAGSPTAPEGNPTRSGTAHATVSVQWPPRTETRLIPVASNGVRITISNGAGFSASQVIARPATGTTFANLPPGNLTVTATAHADAEGNVSPAQASGTQTVTAVAEETFAINLTMGSTIDRIDLSQSTPAIVVGDALVVAATARDAAGNMVLTGASTFQWSTNNARIATVTPNGASATVLGLTTGAAAITVTETESGKTATLPVTAAYPTITTTTGLQYQDVVIGTGRFPVPGKRVAVYYKGTFKDGTVFDSRLAPANAFIFTIGLGQVIKGWDEGVAGMREGGKRKLFVPSDLAYGTTGSQGGTIPPNTPIDFEVELLEIEL